MPIEKTRIFIIEERNQEPIPPAEAKALIAKAKARGKRKPKPVDAANKALEIIVIGVNRSKSGWRFYDGAGNHPYCLRYGGEPFRYPVEREHRFHPMRKWSFDIAIPLIKIAIEIDGGTWSATAIGHQRAGLERDYEKMNAATVMGWRVLRYTTAMMRRRGGAQKMVDQILEAIEATK